MPNTAARFLAAAGLLLTLSDAAQAAGLDAVQGAWTMVGNWRGCVQENGVKNYLSPSRVVGNERCDHQSATEFKVPT